MTGRAGWRRALKALHELAAIGVGGGLAACLVIGITANIAAPAEFAAARQAIAAIARYVLLPSLALVLVTGLLAIAATRGYHDAGWAWVKALLGIGVFEATLFTVGASSRQAELAAAAVTDPGLLALAARVAIHIDTNPDLNALSPQRLIVDGVEIAIPDTLGSPAVPLTPAQAAAKLTLARDLALAADPRIFTDPLGYFTEIA